MMVPMMDLSMQIGSYAMGASDEVTDGTKSYGKPNKMGTSKLSAFLTNNAQ